VRHADRQASAGAVPVEVGRLRPRDRSTGPSASDATPPPKGNLGRSLPKKAVGESRQLEDWVALVFDATRRENGACALPDDSGGGSSSNQGLWAGRDGAPATGHEHHHARALSGSGTRWFTGHPPAARFTVSGPIEGPGVLAAWILDSFPGRTARGAGGTWERIARASAT